MKGANLITVGKINPSNCLKKTIRTAMSDLGLSTRKLLIACCEISTEGTPHIHVLTREWVQLYTLRTQAQNYTYSINVKYVEEDGIGDTFEYLKKTDNWVLDCSCSVDCAACAKRLSKAYLELESLKRSRKQVRDLVQQKEVEKLKAREARKRTLSKSHERNLYRKKMGWPTSYKYRPIECFLLDQKGIKKKLDVKDLSTADGHVRHFIFELNEKGKLKENKKETE